MNRPDLSSVDLNVFRTIMGSLTSGVSVVTGLDQEGNPCGMTSSAVCSVSADPPLLLTCVKPPSRTLDAIRARGCFAVNFLDAEGSEFSDLFASRTRDKFAHVGWRPSEVAGVPLLDRTVAYAECTVHDLVSAGDHVIVLGRIVSGAVAPEKFPLGYWRGRYVRVFRVASGVPRRSQNGQE